MKKIKQGNMKVCVCGGVLFLKFQVVREGLSDKMPFRAET